MLAELALRFLNRAIDTLGDYYTERANREVARAEKKFAQRLASLLAMPLKMVQVRLKVYPDGTTLPLVELKFGPSQKQMEKAVRFLEELTPLRSNVRPASPMVN